MWFGCNNIKGFTNFLKQLCNPCWEHIWQHAIPTAMIPLLTTLNWQFLHLKVNNVLWRLRWPKTKASQCSALPIAFIENLLEFILRLHPYSWILNLTSLTCHNKFLYKNITANIYEHFIAHFDCMNICPKAHNLQPTFFLQHGFTQTKLLHSHV